MLLALEAATLNVSLALGDGPPGARRVVAELEIPPGVNSSDRLPQAVAELLASAGLNLRELRGIAVGTGPGSLTGLRVAHSTAKALAYAQRIPLLGISSLEAMALEAPAGSEFLVPVLDARRGDLFTGFFRHLASGLEVIEPALALPAEALAEKLRDRGPLRVFGPAVALVQPALEKAGLQASFEGPQFPRARALLALAPELPAFDLSALFRLEPRYVRAPESEWTIKAKKPKP